MFGLIAAGAAILFGGAWVLCKVLESGNRAKREELERSQARAEREVRQRTAAIAQAERERSCALRRRSLAKAVKAATDEESLAVRQWRDIKLTIGGLLEQTASAYRRKNELKHNLNARKKELVSAAHGRWVDFGADTACMRLLDQIRELSSFCQSLVEHQRAMIENKRRLFAVMRECNVKAAEARRRLFAFESDNLLLNYC